MGAERQFGFPAEEAIGQQFETLVHGDCAHDLELAMQRGSGGFDTWMKTRSEDLFWGTITVQRVSARTGRPLIYAAFVQDRTSVKLTIEGLERRIRDIEAAQQAKDRFIARLSHELRSPLSAIMCGAEAMLQGSQLEQDDRELIEIVVRQADSLHHLVNDLLDASRLATGKLHLRREVVPLDDILRTAAETCRPLAEHRAQQLNFDILAPQVCINCDPQRMRQVFVNLIQNAIKYTPDKGWLRIEASTDGQEAVIRVRDSGVGIDAETLPRIFEMFSQSNANPRLSEQGLGIGLFVVREIVSLHEGRIEAHSEGPGHGSEFIVHLPCAPTAEPSTTDAQV
jgi:PAS domain S-box-containing protein